MKPVACDQFGWVPQTVPPQFPPQRNTGCGHPRMPGVEEKAPHSVSSSRHRQTSTHHGRSVWHGCLFFFRRACDFSCAVLWAKSAASSPVLGSATLSPPRTVCPSSLGMGCAGCDFLSPRAGDGGNSLGEPRGHSAPGSGADDATVSRMVSRWAGSGWIAGCRLGCSSVVVRGNGTGRGG